jgi:two-component system nitrate/nitrite response regulator NarL
MSEVTARVLILSDIPEADNETLQALAEANDLQVIGKTTAPAEAIGLARTHQPDIAIVDYDIPGMDGAETARAILRESDRTQIIMVSVFSEPDDIRTAMRAGARDYLIKPLDEGELVETIRWLLRERREYARMTAFVKQMRRAYEALFTDDKPVPPTVLAFLEAQAEKSPGDRLALETLAVAYARNREWAKLAPIVASLSASS